MLGGGHVQEPPQAAPGGAHQLHGERAGEGLQGMVSVGRARKSALRPRRVRMGDRRAVTVAVRTLTAPVCTLLHIDTLDDLGHRYEDP